MNSRRAIASNNFKGGVVAQSRKSMERGDFKGLSELYVVARWAFNAQLLQGKHSMQCNAMHCEVGIQCSTMQCNTIQC